MKNITTSTVKEVFGTIYKPIAALVFYQEQRQFGTGAVSVEYFDFDRQGFPVNAHPLTVREAATLKGLLKTDERTNDQLIINGILGPNILSLDQISSRVIWYTKPMKRKLLFVEQLNIPSVPVNIPSLLWVGDRNRLRLFALKSSKRPEATTSLHHAPFPNIHADGTVCMGTVNVIFKKNITIDEFVHTWEEYFFNSHFSHLMAGHVATSGNCLNHWKRIAHTGEKFPVEILKKSAFTPKNIAHET